MAIGLEALAPGLVTWLRVWAMIPVETLVPGDNDVDLLVVDGLRPE